MADLENLIMRGVAGSRPAAGIPGRLYYDTTNNKFQRDTGATWEDCEPLTSVNPFAPWLVDIIPAISEPSATTGTWGLTSFAGTITYPFITTQATGAGASALYNSSNAQNDAISWDVVLSAGTWDISFHARKSTNTAIITCNIDGSSVGTVDTYAGAAAFGKVQITGITVSTDGKHTVQLKAATRNASNSTGWYLQVFGISMRRTA